MWLALVVFTSGIVDERPGLCPWSSQYCQLAGVEPEGYGVGTGVGTLLSFEESGIPSDRGLFFRTFQDRSVVGRDGLGGCVVCELDSGREHLWQLFTRSCHFLTPPAMPRASVEVGRFQIRLCGWWCSESL